MLLGENYKQPMQVWVVMKEEPDVITLQAAEPLYRINNGPRYRHESGLETGLAFRPKTNLIQPLFDADPNKPSKLFIFENPYH